MAKKIKGKQWYTIIAPKMFDKKALGETPVGDPETVMNRTISIPLVNLINDPSKYYIKFYFKVKEADGDKALTEFWGFQCLRDYISRMIRHGVLRIDNVMDLETKDKVKIRVKTIAVTSRKAKKEVEVSLRKFIKEKVSEEIPKLTLDNFVKKTLDDSIKRTIIEEGSKIYPIYKFELRKVERLE
ncbi:MAG: 30S ribosomal protein S3ae [Candidatus Aenigmarchaeota archaeon]|nr:30S ribosomal protein S3ae [Candidatus Aenigmarchaeota archaeon]